MKFFDYDLSQHGWKLLQRHVDEIEAVFADRKRPGGFIQAVLENRLHSAIVWGNDEDLAHLRDLVRFVGTLVPYELLKNVYSDDYDVWTFCNPESFTRFRIDAEGRIVEINVWTGEETIEE
jgi:hypothetical protein